MRMTVPMTTRPTTFLSRARRNKQMGPGRSNKLLTGLYETVVSSDSSTTSSATDCDQGSVQVGCRGPHRPTPGHSAWLGETAWGPGRGLEEVGKGLTALMHSMENWDRNPNFRTKIGIGILSRQALKLGFLSQHSLSVHKDQNRRSYVSVDPNIDRVWGQTLYASGTQKQSFFLCL